MSGVADVVDAEELLWFVVDADEATINSLEINTTYTFHNKMSLKIILLEFFYSMFSFNPFVINNQAIGDRQRVLIVAILQQLFHFTGFDGKLFAYGIKGLVIDDCDVKVTIGEEIVWQILEKPLMLVNVIGSGSLHGIRLKHVT